jgi:hypothetical protein
MIDLAVWLSLTILWHVRANACGGWNLVPPQSGNSIVAGGPAIAAASRQWDWGVGLTSACASRPPSGSVPDEQSVGSANGIHIDCWRLCTIGGCVHDNSSGFLSGNVGGVESFVGAHRLVSASRSAHFERCLELTAANAPCPPLSSQPPHPWRSALSVVRRP